MRNTILISILTFLYSCNNTDFSNPEEVIRDYRKLSLENNNEILYDDFLSTKSKEFVTKDEYIKTQQIPDSTIESTELLETKISAFPIDVNTPSYRRFKVEGIKLFKTDTIHYRIYHTLINENGKWKVIWVETLLSFAKQKFNDGNYSEARKTLESIIEINSYDGRAYDLLAWCYLRDASLAYNDWENGVVNNAKYAIALEEENPRYFNTLGAYYSRIGNWDLAIEKCERGLSLCQNKNDKSTLYSNLASNYVATKKYDKAEEYIKKSIEIDSEDALVWFNYGYLMSEQKKYSKAIEYYKTAISKSKMDNGLQGALYYSYAKCLKKVGNCVEAKKIINKALDIEPSYYKYKVLYNKIKTCK